MKDAGISYFAVIVDKDPVGKATIDFARLTAKAVVL
jgi:hypothetical protein